MRSRSNSAPVTRREKPDGRQAAADYLNALEHQRRLSRATLRNYAHAIDALLKFLEEKDLESLEPAQVRRFIAMLHAKGLSPRTLALTLSAWRGFYRWLARYRDFGANPVLGIRAPKAARPLPKALSVESTELLFNEAGQDQPALIRDRAMFELLYSSGLRLGELVALDIGDGRLDLRQGEVTVTGKGAKTRTVPIGAKAREALAAWLNARQAAPGEKALFIGARGKRISAGMVGTRLKQWARRRGLHEKVHPHMLRHSTGYKLANDGHDTRAIQHYLGHKNIQHAVRYTEMSPQRFNGFWKD
jgi:integrase/recombinase XerC